jgi:hypothetical protein
MLEPQVELALRDITRRLAILMEQVSNGELVDTNLLVTLNDVSEQCFIKHVAGEEINHDELIFMEELLSLLEMRTTLIYRNPSDD